MGKKLTVRSKIAPNHVAIIEVPWIQVAEETFDLYKFVYKLTIKPNVWTSDTHEIGRLTCPSCGKVHKDLKMQAREAFDYTFNRVWCTCGALLVLRFWNDLLDCTTYRYEVPDGYELAESN